MFFIVGLIIFLVFALGFIFNIGVYVCFPNRHRSILPTIYVSIIVLGELFCIIYLIGFKNIHYLYWVYFAGSMAFVLVLFIRKFRRKKQRNFH